MSMEHRDGPCIQVTDAELDEAGITGLPRDLTSEKRGLARVREILAEERRLQTIQLFDPDDSESNERVA